MKFQRSFKLHLSDIPCDMQVKGVCEHTEGYKGSSGNEEKQWNHFLC